MCTAVDRGLSAVVRSDTGGEEGGEDITIASVGCRSRIGLPDADCVQTLILYASSVDLEFVEAERFAFHPTSLSW